MSFPHTLSALLTAQGLRQTGDLSFALPTASRDVEWHLSFRTLGFAKDQIDGTLRYRHSQSTDFAWTSLARFGGQRWKTFLANRTELLSGGFALGPLLGWRSNHTFDNHGLSPDAAAARVAEDIQIHALPFAASINDHAALHALLCRDEEPFPWSRSQGLLRLAEIARLEAVLGAAPTRVFPLAELFQVVLQDQLDGVPLKVYVAQILSAAGDA